MRWKPSGLLVKSVLFVAALFYLLGGHGAFACDKKGIGIGPFGGSAAYLKEMNPHWYYDWTPSPPPVDMQMPFVPMVKGIAFRVQSDLQLVASAGRVPILLGFNEPDFSVTNMSVDRAIELWPQLQYDATRVGSPAVTNLDSNWLRKFMAQAREKHLKVDFIAVHYYGPPDAKGFLEGVDRLHDLYGLPIWITEFAVIEKVKYADHPHYTPDDVLKFMQIVLPGLESRSYVERFAWWGIGGADNAEALKSSRFFEDDGSLTQVGRYYASIEANSSGEVCGTP